MRSLEELADVALAFTLLPPLPSRRAGVIGGGGGESVSVADACESAELTVPPLPEVLRDQFRSRFPEVGMMPSNPLDASVTGGPEVFGQAALEVAKWDGVDILIGNSGIEWALDDPQDVSGPRRSMESHIRAAKEAEKPLVEVIGWIDTQDQWRWEAVRACQQLCVEAAVPVYPSIQRAATAICKVASYHEMIRTEDLD